MLIVFYKDKKENKNKMTKHINVVAFEEPKDGYHIIVHLRRET